MKLTEALQKSGTSAILYSESGIGKTHLCASLPGRILIIAAEPNGIKTLAKFPADVQAQIDVVNLPQNNGKPDEYSYALNEFFDNLMVKDLPFDTIVLDSATELANAMLLAKTDLNKNGGAPAQHTYLEVQTAMKRYSRILRDLAIVRGKNVLITALEGELVLQQTSETVNSKTHPSLSGKKLTPEIEGLFDIVGHLEKTSKGDRFVRLEGNDIFVAKDRYGRKACIADGKILMSDKTGAETVQQTVAQTSTAPTEKSAKTNEK